MKFQPPIGTIARTITLAALAYAIAPMRASADEPFAYRSEDGRFSVELPAQPPSVRELTGSKFSITDNNFLHTVLAEGAEYSVEIHDIPRVAELVLSSEYILERTAEGLMEDIGGHEIDAVASSFHGRPAREVDFEIPEREFTGKLLLILAERRLYLVSVQHPQSVAPPDSIAPFFESFSFWPESR